MGKKGEKLTIDSGRGGDLTSKEKGIFLVGRKKFGGGRGLKSGGEFLKEGLQNE